MLRKDIPSYFKERRTDLARRYPGAAFLLPAPREVLRNPDVEFPFRQESNLYYLTGLEEPESAALIVPDAAGHRFVLFVRERDRDKEIWEGERYGVDRAGGIFGADETYSFAELETRLPTLLKNAESLHYRLNRDADMDRLVLVALENLRKTLGRSGRGLLSVIDPTTEIGEFRLRKRPEEIAFLRKAGEASAAAHKAAMEQCRAGMNEADIEALIDYAMRRNGCRRNGYGSIVAGGKNATCLHYRANNEPLGDGDLLLIDAGGEHEYYTADITRTFPVGRRFTPAQAKVYDLVLKSQLETIALCKPGTPYIELYDCSVRVLVEGLVALGLMKGSPDDLIRDGAHKAVYPHGIGHWLGMDVHDLGLYGDDRTRKLEPGMVLTIEPGLYFQPDDARFPAEYRGIGVRIEDNILITENGCENLTAGVPKERSEIEALRVKV